MKIMIKKLIVNEIPIRLSLDSCVTDIFTIKNNS